MTDDLSNIVLFGGSLEELDNFTNERYTIAGEYFESASDIFGLFLEFNCRENLSDKGYDGLIHRKDKAKGLLDFLSGIKYITGVPVKLIEGK